MFDKGLLLNNYMPPYKYQNTRYIILPVNFKNYEDEFSCGGSGSISEIKPSAEKVL